MYVCIYVSMCLCIPMTIYQYLCLFFLVYASMYLCMYASMPACICEHLQTDLAIKGRSAPDRAFPPRHPSIAWPGKPSAFRRQSKRDAQGACSQSGTAIGNMDIATMWLPLYTVWMVLQAKTIRKAFQLRLVGVFWMVKDSPKG